jgi:hypothetical protein
MTSRKLLDTAIACSFLLTSIAVLPACSATQPTQPAVQTPAAQVEPEIVKPIISDLKADSVVDALGTTQVICTATEAGADNLTYNWAATGGAVTGAGSTITWTAPSLSGGYMVTVVVSDGKGGAAKKSVVINVPEKPNHPAVIDAIRYTRPKRMPLTIKPNMTDEEKSKVSTLVAIKYDVVELSCLAHDEDKDPMTYVWKATGGKLIGTGATMQWIAAGEPGTYTISVEVSDGKGAPDVFQITVSVHCCSG